MSSYDQVPEGYRKVYIRMRSVESSEFGNLIQDLKLKAKLLYMVDHTKNNREVFHENKLSTAA